MGFVQEQKIRIVPFCPNIVALMHSPHSGYLIPMLCQRPNFSPLCRAVLCRGRRITLNVKQLLCSAGGEWRPSAGQAVLRVTCPTAVVADDESLAAETSAPAHRGVGPRTRVDVMDGRIYASELVRDCVSRTFVCILSVLPATVLLKCCPISNYCSPNRKLLHRNCSASNVE